MDWEIKRSPERIRFEESLKNRTLGEEVGEVGEVGEFKTEVKSEKDEGSYIVRDEVVDDGHETKMKSAYSKKDGSYIGDPETAKMLDEKGIAPEKSAKDHNVASIGFSSKDGKWYGWSHRAIYGFKVGSKCEKGDCGYKPKKGEWTAKTSKDAKQMAIDFADGVS